MVVTERLDRALAAMHECRLRTPELKAVFDALTPQAEALNALIAALDLADRALRAPRGEPREG
jgi:hypothetical protein